MYLNQHKPRRTSSQYSGNNDHKQRIHLSHVLHGIDDIYDSRNVFEDLKSRVCSSMGYKRHSLSPLEWKTKNRSADASPNVYRIRRLKRQPQDNVYQQSTLKLSMISMENASNRKSKMSWLRLRQLRSNSLLRMERVRARKVALEIANEARKSQLLERLHKSSSCATNESIPTRRKTIHVNPMSQSNHPRRSKTLSQDRRSNVAFGSTTPRPVCYSWRQIHNKQTMNSNSACRESLRKSTNMSASARFRVAPLISGHTVHKVKGLEITTCAQNTKERYSSRSACRRIDVQKLANSAFSRAASVGSSYRIAKRGADSNLVNSRSGHSAREYRMRSATVRSDQPLKRKLDQQPVRQKSARPQSSSKLAPIRDQKMKQWPPHETLNMKYHQSTRGRIKDFLNPSNTPIPSHWKRISAGRQIVKPSQSLEWRGQMSGYTKLVDQTGESRVNTRKEVNSSGVMLSKTVRIKGRVKWQQAKIHNQPSGLTESTTREEEEDTTEFTTTTATVIVGKGSQFLQVLVNNLIDEILGDSVKKIDNGVEMSLVVDPSFSPSQREVSNDQPVTSSDGIGEKKVATDILGHHAAMLYDQEIAERVERKKRLELIMSRLKSSPKYTVVQDECLTTLTDIPISSQSSGTVDSDGLTCVVQQIDNGKQLHTTPIDKCDLMEIRPQSNTMIAEVNSGDCIPTADVKMDAEISLHDNTDETPKPLVVTVHSSEAVKPSRADVVSNMLASGRLDGQSRAAHILLNLTSGRPPLDGLQIKALDSDKHGELLVIIVTKSSTLYIIYASQKE